MGWGGARGTPPLTEAVLAVGSHCGGGGGGDTPSFGSGVTSRFLVLQLEGSTQYMSAALIGSSQL